MKFFLRVLSCVLLIIFSLLYAGPDLTQVEANLTDAVLTNNQVEYVRSLLDLHALGLTSSQEDTIVQTILNKNGSAPIPLDTSSGIAPLLPNLQYFTTAENLGTGTGIFASQDSTYLQFYSLTGTGAVSISAPTSGTIIISSTAEANTASAMTTTQSDAVSIVGPQSGTVLQFKNLVPKTNMIIYADPDGSDVDIATTTNPFLVDVINQYTTGSGTEINGLIIKSGTYGGVSYISENPASSNVSLSLAPTGTGFIVVSIPDGTAAGGNIRGQNAVDLQMSRAFSAQVTSGNNSSILGGINNTVAGVTSGIVAGTGNSISSNNSDCVVGSGNGNSINSYSSDSCIGGGVSNTISTSQSFIGAGQSNSVTGSNSSIVGGYGNLVSGQQAFIGGGQQNTASNSYAIIGGGLSNSSSGQYSGIGGGFVNAASATYAWIGGGHNNNSIATASTVSGGDSNRTTSACTYATIGGGFNNLISNTAVTVAGGYQNNVSGPYAAVGGGRANVVSVDYAVVSGGNSNAIRTGGIQSFIGGGISNVITGSNSVITGGVSNVVNGTQAYLGGGQNNTVSAVWSTVSGGFSNTASGNYAVVPGGNSNTASSANSFAAGTQAQAVHQGAFVLSDSQAVNFSSTTTDQLSARFQGGTSINNWNLNQGVSAGINYVSAAPTTNNTSICLVPKGSGFIAAAIPDGTTAGGNARGSNSVDLQQTSRGNAAQVASGSFSAIISGLLNTASGTASIVGSGGSNTASNTYSAVLGGEGNTASGDSSIVGGGGFNTASGSNSVVPGGSTNTASGDNSFAAGTHAKAVNTGAFVLSDSQTVDFSSTVDDQLSARFQGGTSINNWNLNQGSYSGSNYISATATPTTNNTTICIIPTGTGAFVAAIPDGTTTGGDIRGQNAVDLQMSRASSSQVTSGNNSSILGGVNNAVAGATSGIVAGTGNRILSNNSDCVIVGGNGNTINDYSSQSFIGSGISNSITTTLAFIGSGQSNTVNAEWASVVGGSGNTASGPFAFIGGGNSNTASGFSANVASGSNNLASGTYSIILGGQSNTASAQSSLAAGTQAQAVHQGAFVLSDSQNVNFSSTTTDQLSARFQGGTSINNWNFKQGVAQGMNYISATVTPTTNNTSLCLVPTGTGALVAAVPDAASTGGNARGQRAVDLQLNRSAATQVASGNNSTIIGGQNNTASGANSLAAGTQAQAVHQGAFVLSDSQNVNFSSTTTDQLNARFQGGTSINNWNFKQGVAQGMNYISATVTPTTNNTSLCLVPTGTGALIAAVPDAASTGGNARGQRAVDLQLNRAAATQVASGNNSVILGGQSNTASGANSLAAGTQAQAIHQGAFVLSDSQASSFASTANDQLATRFQGGYRLIAGANTGLICVADVTNDSNGQLVCGCSSDTRKQFFMEYHPTNNWTVMQSVQFGVTATNLYLNPFPNAPNGYVGVNQTTANYPLDVNGAAHATSFPTSSDARLKKNVTYLKDEAVLEKIMQLKPCTFNWNERHPAYESYVKNGHEELQVGFIAQEVEDLFPYLVTTWSYDHRKDLFRRHTMRKNIDFEYAAKSIEFNEEDFPEDCISDYRALDYSRMVALLTRAVQEQQMQLIQFRTELDELKKQLEMLQFNSNK